MNHRIDHSPWGNVQVPENAGPTANAVDDVTSSYPLEAIDRHGVETIIDIGANVGLFALKARRHLKPKRIICYEPYSENFACLKENTKYLPDIEIHQAAVLGHNGRCGLINPHGYHTTWTACGHGYTVCLDASEIVQEVGRVDLLKIDCEGGEWDIIPRLKDLHDNIRFVMVEYHCDRPGRNPHAFMKLLEENLPSMRRQRHMPRRGFGVLFLARNEGLAL